MAAVLNFPRKCIYLIGARASGKSTVGRLLAQRLNWPLAETDALAEGILGQTIAKTVSEQGWDAFRRAESEALLQAASLEPAVISTGGGIVLREENCKLMQKTGLIVYLKASAQELGDRLEKSLGSRPSLTGAHPAREIAQVLADREELYCELAHLTVNVHRPAAQVARHIYSLLVMRGAQGNILHPVSNSAHNLPDHTNDSTAANNSNNAHQLDHPGAQAKEQAKTSNQEQDGATIKQNNKALQ